MIESPRLLRPVGAPLALYLRPGRNDHGILLGLLAEGREDISGIVFDPCLEARQAELLTEVRRHHIEAVLDPRTIELATPGGVAQGRVTELPWAGQQQPHTTELLSSAAGAQLVDAIAEYVLEHNFSAVLAPTHYLRSATDPWLEIDTRLMRRLRRILDAAGKVDVPIYYPLALPTAVLHDTRQRTALVAALAGLPLDALWLRVHPFGSASGPLALPRRPGAASARADAPAAGGLAAHTGCNASSRAAADLRRGASGPAPGRCPSQRRRLARCGRGSTRGGNDDGRSCSAALGRHP